MEPSYSLFADLAAELPTIPPDSIVSRTLVNEENLKLILFGFAAGQELSEHTASRPAMLHFLSGQADLTLGEDALSVEAGAWVRMPARLPHSVYARTVVVMLLYMV
ncbi:MAG: cupin [Caldilineaceae bacterium]|nr:cupin [Caldilineaceae bacterium]